MAHSRIISGKRSGRQMLHYLRAEDAVERGFGQVLQVYEQVGGLRIETLVAAGGDGFLAEIDAACGNPVRPHHLQELAAPAADIEHVRIFP